MAFLKAVGRVFTYAVVTAIVTLLLAMALSGSSRSTQRQILREGQQTRRLICSLLINSDNPDIVRAVREFCPPPYGR